MQVRDMAFSDREVYRALQELVSRRGPEARISQAEISQVSAVPIATTVRSLKRLRTAGQIIGEFERGIGYRYTIPNADART